MTAGFDLPNNPREVVTGPVEQNGYLKISIGIFLENYGLKGRADCPPVTFDSYKGQWNFLISNRISSFKNCNDFTS